MDAGERGASGRTEERHAENGREDAVRVRWRGPEGQGAVTAEMQLLASLEVSGITAAPDVLGIEEDGYVRETAPELARRRGRRAAGAASPATGERLAQARAREDLEALVAALHERGWVLGAPRGRGLGVRADGRVVVLDLSGLRREEGLSARSADLHWIDSVLEDEERTLRRRIHALPGAGAGQAPFAAVGASLPGAPREEPGREVFAGFDGEPPAGPASSAQARHRLRLRRRTWTRCRARSTLRCPSRGCGGRARRVASRTRGSRRRPGRGPPGCEARHRPSRPCWPSPGTVAPRC
jgi:hypothetical protein